MDKREREITSSCSKSSDKIAGVDLPRWTVTANDGADTSASPLGAKPLSSSTYCHSCGSCPGTTSIRRSIGVSPLMLCPQPLACTMLILVSVGSPFRIGSTIFGHAQWLRVCWLCSLLTLNLGACFQLFCYPCMSCWRSHHLRGCM